MGHERSGLFSGLGWGQSLKGWQRALRRPGQVPTSELERMARAMRGMRDTVDQLAMKAERERRSRAAQHMPETLPEQCDWSARPGPWRDRLQPPGQVNLPSPSQLSGGVTVFHDGTDAQIILRQDPVPGAINGAPYGLVLEVYGFDGSFVSFVQDLPPEALIGLTRQHFVAVHLVVDREQPVEIYARLNVQHGPNTEQIVRQVEFDDQIGRAEFDLAYTKINEKRLEKAWLDLIIERPDMTRIALWDLILLRAPRADL